MQVFFYRIRQFVFSRVLRLTERHVPQRIVGAGARFRLPASLPCWIGGCFSVPPYRLWC